MAQTEETRCQDSLAVHYARIHAFEGHIAALKREQARLDATIATLECQIQREVADMEARSRDDFQMLLGELSLPEGNQ